MKTFVQISTAFHHSLSLSKKGDVRYSGSNVAEDEEKICGK